MARKDKEPNEIKNVGSYCSHCENPTAFFLYKAAEFERRGEALTYYFGTCQYCNGPGIFTTSDSPDEARPESLRRVFPLHRSMLACQLPVIAQKSYEEALRCEEAKAWLASVVMVGRTLEAVCKEHFPEEKSLSIFRGIDRLYAEGIISEQLKTWANELRILRNIGAHATEIEVSEPDAKEAIDFLRAILENLYDLTPKFTEFKARRQGA